MPHTVSVLPVRMTRVGAIFGVAAALSGCASGDYTGDIGGNAGDGTTPLYGAVTATPTAAGSFAGVADANTTVIRDAKGNGYSFAYAEADAATYGDTAAASGARGQFAIAGLLPGTTFGTTPASGSALMSGSYDMVVISGANGSDDPSDWTVTRPSGTVTATIDFSTGKLSGTSADGSLTLARPTGTGFTNGFTGTVSYLGTPGTFAGTLGADNAAAVMTGQDSDRFYAGGFAIGR